MSCTRTSSRARALRSRPWPGSGVRSSALRMRTVTCTPPVCGLPNPDGPQQQDGPPGEQQAQAFASVGARTTSWPSCASSVRSAAARASSSSTTSSPLTARFSSGRAVPPGRPDPPRGRERTRGGDGWCGRDRRAGGVAWSYRYVRLTEAAGRAEACVRPPYARDPKPASRSRPAGRTRGLAAPVPFPVLDRTAPPLHGRAAAGAEVSGPAVRRVPWPQPLRPASWAVSIPVPSRGGQGSRGWGSRTLYRLTYRAAAAPRGSGTT
ncbi:hypothetical protein OEIGOIKO_00143 [Streptomyces chrestomyceticus JCM 4735]|uniref:Uncharacterized protein n=1 Tax=Streptomyces chrestomyceticus JCM 4735 TaxID=1306181 RepID=A0A7U9KND1_9ACTN|nr:hypothetical protein OEIGOIKO_00143 [Streptomyces chrestomyceticus JCM 4735]